MEPPLTDKIWAKLVEDKKCPVPLNAIQAEDSFRSEHFFVKVCSDTSRKFTSLKSFPYMEGACVCTLSGSLN